jgi:hypothetical protein
VRLTQEVSLKGEQISGLTPQENPEALVLLACLRGNSAFGLCESALAILNLHVLNSYCIL